MQNKKTNKKECKYGSTQLFMFDNTKSNRTRVENLTDQIKNRLKA